MRILSFQEFLNRKFSWFEIDPSCETIVHYMNLWANRDKGFEEKIPAEFIIHRKIKDNSEGPGLFTTEKVVEAQTRLFLDKGFCIIGPVGSGKTVLMELLGHYLRYLKSPYSFSITSVPDVAATIRLNEDQEEVMRRYTVRGNYMFDELAKEDPHGELNDEKINLFGNKCLLGDAILHRRHNLFTREGYQTHFTTNHNLTSLSVLYDERFISRLLYCCNVITYVGEDRRPNSRPIFFNNKNIDYSDLQTDADENNGEAIKNILEEKYQLFLEGKLRLNSITYQQLSVVGIQAADESRWKVYFSEALIKRKEELSQPRNSVPESQQRKAILEMYATGKLSDAENAKLKDHARTIAVRHFFEDLKNKGSKKIFQ